MNEMENDMTQQTNVRYVAAGSKWTLKYWWNRLRYGKPVQHYTVRIPR